MKKWLKRFKRKIKYNRKANNILLFIIVMFLFMGVGYAYLNATLTINGTGKVTKTTWDVHFENIQPVTGSVSPTIAPVISNDTTVSFSATLNEPGDFYSFDIDLVNAGTIDASIGSLDITPVLTSEQQEYFEYSIKYKGGLNVQEGDALSHGDTKTIEILFRYKELDNHDLYPDEDVTFNFSITINAIQGSYNKELSVLRATSSSDRTAYRSDTYRNNIKTITLDDHINPPSGYIESWDVSEGNNGNVMAYITTNGDDSTMYDLYIQGNGHLYAPEDSSFLFSNIYNAEEFINLNILDTSNVTDMSYMFMGISGMDTLDLSSFDTSNVTDMSYMFSTIEDFPPVLKRIIGIENFKTTNVTDISYMFSYQTYLEELDLSGWNTSNITDMSFTFNQCSRLRSLNINGWNTSNVTDMSNMFYACSKLESLNVTSFNTAQVTSMRGMFESCTSLTSLNLTFFNTSNVTDMSFMFWNSHRLSSLDLSSFNTNKVTSMQEMFKYCDRLDTIIVSNNFVTSNVTNSNYMFTGCTFLVGGNGTTYNSSYTDKTYARIDAPGTPGYFTSS